MRFRRFLMAIVLFAVAASAFAQAPNITGLRPEAAEHLPGLATLFATRSASEPPRLIGVDFIPGQVLARFPLEMIDGEIEQLARSSGARRVERLSPLGLFLLHGTPTVRATERLMQRLWATQTAVAIDANYLGQLTFTPDDPHHVAGYQWYHEAPSDIDLDLRIAWDVTRGSSNVVVAAIDTGIRTDHPEFVGRLYVNPGEIPGNLIDDDGNGYVDDVSGWNAVDVNGDVYDTTSGHGTYVASILLANTDNTHQVAGFDHSARLLPLKALAGQFGQASHFLATLDYLVANPGIAAIVNMSIANYREAPLLEAALSAVAESSILIGGSGNGSASGGADVGYPESHPDVITVGGTDRYDALASFSDTGNSVEFSAPAVDIYTASFAEPDNPLAAYVESGTSFSSPMVSGIASLGLSIRPSMTESDLIYALRESAVDLGDPGWDPGFGWGRVNAHEALVALQDLIFIDGFETGDLSAWSYSSP